MKWILQVSHLHNVLRNCLSNIFIDCGSNINEFLNSKYNKQLLYIYVYYTLKVQNFVNPCNFQNFNTFFTRTSTPIIHILLLEQWDDFFFFFSVEKERTQDDDQETATPLLLFIKQNLEGFGWKFLLLWRSWLEGLMTWRRNALMELAFAITANSHLVVLLDESWWWVIAFWEFLWRLHLKEPGCLVGEHKHERFVEGCGFGFEPAILEAMARN